MVRPCNRNGGIAQLVEHELCKLGVAGSNPVASTRQIDDFVCYQPCLRWGILKGEKFFAGACTAWRAVYVAVPGV